MGDGQSVVLFAQDEEFEVDHPVAGRNRGLSLRIAADSLAAWRPSGASHLGRRGGPVGRLGREASVLARRLVRRLARHGNATGDPLEVGEAVIALLARVVPLRETTPPIARARVNLAREVLLRRFRERLSLQDIADEVGWTACHLSREFARAMGTGLHAYLNRVRLHAALNELPDTTSLANLALKHGFSSHSHFSAAFKREFNCTPSALQSFSCPAPSRRSPSRSSPRPVTLVRHSTSSVTRTATVCPIF